MPRPEAAPVLCPECGMDAREVGFTTMATVTVSYMPIGGRPTRVASTERAPDKAFCFLCDAELPGANPCDLMRAT